MVRKLFFYLSSKYICTFTSIYKKCYNSTFFQKHSIHCHNWLWGKNFINMIIYIIFCNKETPKKQKTNIYIIYICIWIIIPFGVCEENNIELEFIFLLVKHIKKRNILFIPFLWKYYYSAANFKMHNRIQIIDTTASTRNILKFYNFWWLFEFLSLYIRI